MTDLTAGTLRLLRGAGLLSFGFVVVPAFFQGVQAPASFVFWAGGLVAFGGLFTWSSVRPQAPRPVLLAVIAAEAACVILMVATQCRGYEGALLVLVALQLGRLLPRSTGLPWIAVQSVLLFWAIQHHWSLRPAILMLPPYLGFQVLAYFLMEILEREARVRAEAGRALERLRIARELHDAMGHHLAALSLNLEAARRDAPASSSLLAARELARRLLDDVESAVTALTHDRGIDLGRALRALAADIPNPCVHVEAHGVEVRDPERAHALLRCCQEIVTNAVKHAGAANVWIKVQRRDSVLELEAHDDGTGGRPAGGGQGLEGMQARLAEMGGALAFDSAPGAGFRLRATLPERPRV